MFHRLQAMASLYGSKLDWSAHRPIAPHPGGPSFTAFAPISCNSLQRCWYCRSDICPILMAALAAKFLPPKSVGFTDPIPETLERFRFIPDRCPLREARCQRKLDLYLAQ